MNLIRFRCNMNPTEKQRSNSEKQCCGEFRVADPGDLVGCSYQNKVGSGFQNMDGSGSSFQDLVKFLSRNPK